MFYSLAAPSWGPEEIKAIERVVDSGMFTMGENVARFEEAFAKYFGMKYGVMVNSGSSANLVAVGAVAVGVPVASRAPRSMGGRADQPITAPPMRTAMMITNPASEPISKRLVELMAQPRKRAIETLDAFAFVRPGLSSGQTWPMPQ